MTNIEMMIHNTQTNEIVTRNMNDDELRQWELDNAKFQAQMQDKESKIMAKNNLLQKLGITEDEAKLLLS